MVLAGVACVGAPTPFPTPSLQPDAAQVARERGGDSNNFSRLVPRVMVTRHSITRVTCAGGAFLAVKQHLGYQLHHVVSARSAIGLRPVVFVVTRCVTRALQGIRTKIKTLHHFFVFKFPRENAEWMLLPVFVCFCLDPSFHLHILHLIFHISTFIRDIVTISSSSCIGII